MVDKHSYTEKEARSIARELLLDVVRPYDYRWVHLPTGETGIDVAYLSTRLEFLEALNVWNKDGKGRWLYVEG